jgi:hypothetical protein
MLKERNPTEEESNLLASSSLLAALKLRYPKDTSLVEINENGSVKNWYVIGPEGIIESKPGSGQCFCHPGAHRHSELWRGDHIRAQTELEGYKLLVKSLSVRMMIIVIFTAIMATCLAVSLVVK